jgi:hypothetical protein
MLSLVGGDVKSKFHKFEKLIFHTLDFLNAVQYNIIEQRSRRAI